jgi:3-hydroxyisobutyrate dehydrogenase-like beta-hydroxyacid dehydrogenase
MNLLTPVCIVGAGNMGAGMLARLRQLEWLVAVHDTNAKAQQHAVALGAKACVSAEQAAQQLSDNGVLLVVVVDAAQTEAVLWGEGGAVQAMKPGQTVMLCPTLGPATVENQAERLAQSGIDCIDAPMSGGPLRAQDGSMSLMVACSEPVWLRHQDLLNALSRQVFRVGTRAGDGARTKLVNNLLAAVTCLHKPLAKVGPIWTMRPCSNSCVSAEVLAGRWACLLSAVGRGLDQSLQ